MALDAGGVGKQSNRKSMIDIVNLVVSMVGRLARLRWYAARRWYADLAWHSETGSRMERQALQYRKSGVCR